MKSLAWQILCYTLLCKSDEQVNPWVSVSGLLSLHSEQDPNPGTGKKLYLKMMLEQIQLSSLVLVLLLFEISQVV